MTEFEGRTALVTGGAVGIGRAIAVRLARDGARVVVTDVQDGAETVAAIEAAGGEGEFRAADVTDDAAMAEAVAGLDLDVLVNNAAYYAPLVTDKKRFDEIDREEWETVLSVNVTGPFVASKAALPRMEEGGSIVNLSSSTVHLGVPGFLHYVASKAAVIGMTRAMATELGDLGIRVNAVTPGLTRSEATLQNDEAYLEAARGQQALPEPIEPEHVADAVVFLAGPESARVTGQVLNVDAGTSFY
jgi:NAD(P)-dependent dehydrogenase (short-subunit alcohol dehydrogenase family)